MINSENRAHATQPYGKMTLAFGEVGHCIVLTHTTDPPSDAEWRAWVDALARYLQRTRLPRLLILSHGGAPSPTQRRLVDAVSAPHYGQMKVAVVSASTFVRGVVTAFRLALPFYRAFAPNELTRALQYLDVTPDRHAFAKGRVEALFAETAGGAARPA